MKLAKFANLMTLGLALTVAVAGCKKKPTGVTNLPGQGRTRPGDTGSGLSSMPPISPGPGAGAGLTDLNGKLAPNPEGSHAGWKEDADALKAQTVYFEFDKSAIRSSEQPKLDEVANYLKS